MSTGYARVTAGLQLSHWASALNSRCNPVTRVTVQIPYMCARGRALVIVGGLHGLQVTSDIKINLINRVSCNPGVTRVTPRLWVALSPNPISATRIRIASYICVELPLQGDVPRPAGARSAVTALSYLGTFFISSLPLRRAAIKIGRAHV